jgi:hypothetical protein
MGRNSLLAWSFALRSVVVVFGAIFASGAVFALFSAFGSFPVDGRTRDNTHSGLHLLGLSLNARFWDRNAAAISLMPWLQWLIWQHCS